MYASKAVLAAATALLMTPPAAFAQYPQAQYPQAQYPQAQYPQGQYPPPQESQPPPYGSPQYQQNQDQYARDRAAYEQSRQDYEAARARWERAREEYDRQYGYGAYAQTYGPAPAWNEPGYQPAAGYPSESREDFDRRMAAYENARAEYDRRWGPGAYERAYGPPPVWSAGDYGQDAAAYVSRDPSCTDSKTNRSIGGSVIGALIGSALGSNIAGSGVRTEGAVLGALVGGGVGLAVGRASAKCDEGGYYYSYDQTVPYRESDYDRARRSGRYGYSDYDRMQCRLAPAPVSNSGDYRYVRVCPDAQGRYRITG